MFIACLADTMFVFLAQLFKRIYTCKHLFRPGGIAPWLLEYSNMSCSAIYLYLLLATCLYYKVAMFLVP